MTGMFLTTKPPKPTVKPITLKVRQGTGRPFTAKFVWNPYESTYTQTDCDRDGVGLYKEDGWVILGWKR